MNKNILIFFFCLTPLFCFSQKGILGLPSKLEQIPMGMDLNTTNLYIQQFMEIEANSDIGNDILLDYFEFDGEPYEYAGFYFCQDKLSDILFMRSFNDKYEALAIFYRLASGIDKNYIELPPPDIDESNPISSDGFFNGTYNTKDWEGEGIPLKMSLTLMKRMLDTSDELRDIPYTPECDYTLQIRYTNTNFNETCK